MKWDPIRSVPCNIPCISCIYVYLIKVLYQSVLLFSEYRDQVRWKGSVEVSVLKMNTEHKRQQTMDLFLLQLDMKLRRYINIGLHIFMSDIWKRQQHAVAQRWKSDSWTEKNYWSIISIHCLSSLEFIKVQLFDTVNVVPVICLKFELMWSLWCHVLGVYIKIAHVKKKNVACVGSFLLLIFFLYSALELVAFLNSSHSHLSLSHCVIPLRD